MLHAVKAESVPWIRKSAERFSRWLLRNGSGEWTKKNLALPGIYRSTVSWIPYEGLFTDMWSEPWFQDGMRAFGLLALELEGKIEILKSRDGELFVSCPDGKIIEIAAFLNGESLSIRHDPEFSDLSWDPVRSMYHLLHEYSGDA